MVALGRRFQFGAVLSARSDEDDDHDDDDEKANDDGDDGADDNADRWLPGRAAGGSVAADDRRIGDDVGRAQIVVFVAEEERWGFGAGVQRRQMDAVVVIIVRAFAAARVLA